MCVSYVAPQKWGLQKQVLDKFRTRLDIVGDFELLVVLSCAGMSATSRRAACVASESRSSSDATGYAPTYAVAPISMSCSGWKSCATP